MPLIKIHIAPTQEKPIRIQEYAVGIFELFKTKSALKKALKKGLIKVNDRIVTTAKIIYGGETITLYQLEEITNQKRLKLSLEILFEDDYLAIINKPAGILVSGNKFKTIANALPQNIKPSSQFDACQPQPVHRLDYPTTGLLLIGKTQTAIIKLNQLFKNKEIQKTYIAITISKMNISGSIDFPIDDKEALSKYTVLKTVASERFGFLNLVELEPRTGRRHQLRKHLSAIGNPILGDKSYGKENLILKGKGLYLHALSLDFNHPITNKKMQIKSDIPKRFLKIFP